VSVSPTSQRPALLKSFNEHVEVRNGLGFTAGGIFIPPDVIAAGGITDGDAVNGIAVINFDKKRNTWGRKAIWAVDSTSS
jgi:lipid-binding SYLF domain-containing protein